MKAILLFTVLLCSNALASPVDSLKPRLTSNEPVHIIHINEPEHIIHINDLPEKINPRILAKVDSPSRKNFKLPDKQNSKTVILTALLDEFLHICQANRYLACRKYALDLLKEPTGEFSRENLLQEALRRAVKEGNGWAVSVLSDVAKFSVNFYFGILENYLKKRKSNQDLITLDVLRRKSIEMNSNRARILAREYGYLDYITTYRRPQIGDRILPDASSVAAIKDAIKISNHEQVYTLIQAFFPAGLREAGILSDACQYGDQFAVFYATKDFVMGRKREEQFPILRADLASERIQLEEQNSRQEEQDSDLRDAYKQASNEDIVEFFQQFRGIHKGRWEKFKNFCTTWTRERLGGRTPKTSYIRPYNEIDKFKEDY